MCSCLAHILDSGHAPVHFAVDASPGHLGARVCGESDVLDDEVVKLGLGGFGAKAPRVAAAFAPYVDALQWCKKPLVYDQQLVLHFRRIGGNGRRKVGVENSAATVRTKSCRTLCARMLR